MDVRNVRESKEKMTLSELNEQIKAEELIFSFIEKRDNLHLKKLVENVEPKPDINIKNKNDCTPLSEAAYNAYSIAVKILIDAKADVEAKDKDGHTPLGWAAYKADSVSIKALIDAKADVEAKDKDGHTPLAWAACKGDS